MPSDHYIKKEDIAELFGTTSGVAEETLKKAGVMPIDLGRGRGCGKRWLLSAVMNAIQSIHEKAQPRPARPRSPKLKGGHIGLASMSARDIEKLVRQPLASHPTIQ